MGKQTEGAGAEPGDNFESQAMEILNSMNGEDNKTDDTKNIPADKEEDKNKTEDKSDEGDDKSDDKNKSESENKQNIEEELKIPRSRLNKEISKRKMAEEKLDRIQKKYNEEKERFEKLSPEEKEEQENFRKLGMDTKMSKYEDMIEELKDSMEQRENTIKDLETQISSKKTESLSKRIAELTKQYDGTNGLPKFDIGELIEFGKSENYLPDDPIKLYNLKYQADIFAKNYKKSATKVEKGNKGDYTPEKKNITFDSENFDNEAKAILEGIK